MSDSSSGEGLGQCYVRRMIIQREAKETCGPALDLPRCSPVYRGRSRLQHLAPRPLGWTPGSASPLFWAAHNFKFYMSLLLPLGKAREEINSFSAQQCPPLDMRSRLLWIIWVNETDSSGIRWKGGRERGPGKPAVIGATLSTVACEYTWGLSNGNIRDKNQSQGHS